MLSLELVFLSVDMAAVKRNRNRLKRIKTIFYWTDHCSMLAVVMLGFRNLVNV